MTQTLLSGDVAGNFKALYASIKAEHPELSHRGIVRYIIRTTPGLRRLAEDMGFDLNRYDIAFGKGVA